MTALLRSLPECLEHCLKKVSKTDKFHHKRLKKDQHRLVRSLAPEDRVLLIGVEVHLGV